MKFYLGDRQDITRAGLTFVIKQMNQGADVRYTEDKAELIAALRSDGNAVVVVDYNLFDFNDAEEISIMSDRFPRAHWVLFSEDLSIDFLHSVTTLCPRCGIVLKESSMAEIKEALLFATAGKRYICQQVMEQMLTPEQHTEVGLPKLTKTETEVLKDIALGMTTKEIAAKRYSSFHTINTHRKNIFRKLGVNNLQEATRYALRAGLVDEAEYYI